MTVFGKWLTATSPTLSDQLTKWLQMIMNLIRHQTTRIKMMLGTIQMRRPILAAIPQPLLILVVIQLPLPFTLVINGLNNWGTTHWSLLQHVTVDKIITADIPLAQA
ncbi:hypothetical protein PSTT_12222 [Puccinia striiformis]|uniref:Uncharacterized protein n=1 Tax=Puccinia striiformis TaxID=27350 RepID=A0A2S4UX50_9BASI|nr:hypothetical protein PSTT_12222 [Puccinia striiformis]